MINWKTTKSDYALIKKIANRALTEIPALAKDWYEQDIEMDITACHMNGCPLKLADLLKADGFNFMHDILGINRHINRKTGKLDNHFLPRFAA